MVQCDTPVLKPSIFDLKLIYVQDAIQALDVVLKQAVTTQLGWESIGRCYFPKPGQVIDLGFGKEAWSGIFTSIRPVGWKDSSLLLTLNVDTANKPGKSSAILRYDVFVFSSIVFSLFNN